MPRALTLGNGDLLVNFNARYELVDIYWPYVGRENQTDGHACRMGVWADGKFAWIEHGGGPRPNPHPPHTLVSDVDLTNESLGLPPPCSPAGHFPQPPPVPAVGVHDPPAPPPPLPPSLHPP